MKGSVIMFISIIMWIFGGISLLLGVIETIIYIKETKDFKGYKLAKGCVVEHVSKEGYHYFDDEEFGYDAINYDNDDQSFLVQDGINTNAGVVEFMVNGKKQRILDCVNDTNLMPIGKQVLVRYNPRKHKDAFVVDEFDGTILYMVGIFLVVVGFIIYF